MKYSEVEPLPDRELQRLLSDDSPQSIRTALLALASHGADWRLAQDACLAHLDHPDPDVRGLAATCLGHIGRIHGRLDRHKVLDALRRKSDDPAIAGQVADALDDIDMFVA